jgi:hypothetical protein
MFGIEIQTGSTFNCNATSNGEQQFEDCRFYAGGSAAFAWSGLVVQSDTFGSGIVKFKNCEFDFSNMYVPHAGSHAKITVSGNECICTNCTFVSQNGSPVFATTGSYGRAGRAKAISCDVSSAGSATAGSTNEGKVVLQSCETSSSFVSVASSITVKSATVDVFDSDDGTITSQAGLTFRETFYGQLSQVASEYRTSGANDGTSDFSWKMASNANAQELFSFLDSPPITKYVSSGSQTITVHIAGGASLNDDDFWIEVESPSELASPTAQGKFRTTKSDPLATPTALTSDTSSWTGTGVGTAQKVEVAISPTIAGTVTVRCYLAKPSTTVYVDPKISTDGYQRVFNGVLVDGYAVGGGGAVLHPLRSN